MKEKRTAVSAIAGMLVLGLCVKFAAGSRSVSAVDNVAAAGAVVSEEGIWLEGLLSGKEIWEAEEQDFSARLYERFLQGEIMAEREEQQVCIDELFWNNDIEYCFLDIDGDGSGELQIRDDFAYYVVKAQEGTLRVIWEERRGYEPVDTEEDTAMLSENELEWTDRRLKDFAAWQEAYDDFIRKIHVTVWVPDEGFRYSLIYVDADDVPELYIDTGYPISGDIMVSFYEGKIGCVNRERGGLRYIERGGRLCSWYGATGFYPFNIYMLEKGEFSEIGTGWSSDYADEQGNVCFDFFWEDSPVTEEEFYACIRELIDLSECVEPSLLYSEEEMLELLEE